MSLSDGFFNKLQRHLINGNIKDISRMDQNLSNEALCAPWAYPLIQRYGEDLQPLLHQAGKMAWIILGTNDYEIQFAEQDGPFLERPEANQIIVSTQPLNVYSHAPLTAIDIMTGQIIHQAALIKERHLATEPIDREETLTVLYHLVEHVIVDAIVAYQFPGYEGYLLTFRNYDVDGKLKKQWVMKFESRLFQTMLALRSAYPIRIHRKSVRHAYFYMLHLLLRNPVPSMLRRIDRMQTAQTLYNILYSEKIYAHWGKVNHRSERFVFGEDGPPTPGENGNKKGGEKLNPITGELMRELQHEKHQAFIPDIDDNPGLANKGGHPRPKIGQSAKLNVLDKLQFLPDQGTRKLKTGMAEAEAPRHGMDQQYDYQLRITIPEPYVHATKRYQEAVQAVRPQIAALERQMSETKTMENLNQYGLHTGDLDENSLYKAKYSHALFRKQNLLSEKASQLDVVLLVDVSTSMSETMLGSGIPKHVAAQRMAALLVEALEGIEDVQTWVFSFSSRGKQVDIFELYSPAFQERMRKDRLGDILPFPERQTPEYEALLAVTDRLRREGRTGAQKIFLILSDGKPEDDIMAEQDQHERIRQLARKQQTSGNIVIQFALGEGLDTSRAYPYVISVPKAGYPALIRSFGRLLSKLVK